VGTGYFDDLAMVISSGKSSTTALKGSTEEEQFTEKTPSFRDAEVHHAGASDVVKVEATTPLI